MMLTVEQLKAWSDRSHVEDFLRRGIAEWHHIEYKSDFGKWKAEPNKEFFKDVTAFANANGGDILVGVKEPAEGVASADQVIGVVGDPDALVREWEDRANSGKIDPKIPGLLFQAIPVGTGKCVLVVHVPPSASRPHMAVLQDRRHFWIRHSKEVLPMNSYDIRESVLSAQSYEQRALDLCIREERETLDVQMKGAGYPILIMQAAPVPPPSNRLLSSSHTPHGASPYRRQKCLDCRGLAPASLQCLCSAHGQIPKHHRIRCELPYALQPPHAPGEVFLEGGGLELPRSRDQSDPVA